MRKLVLLLTVFSCFGSAQGQNKVSSIEKGSILVLGTPSYGLDFKHIHFPKRNFIIKRGGIVNYKALVGRKVQVSHVESSTNGETEIVIKPLDGQRFFRVLPKVKTNYQKALNRGELKPI